MPKCFLAHCTNSSNPNGNLLYFRLPYSDVSRKEKWLKALNLKKEINYEGSFICSLHFTPDCIKNGKLKSDSIPTINVQKIDDMSILSPEFVSIDVIKKEAESELSFKVFGYTCRICGFTTDDIENMEPIMDESNNLLDKISQCIPITIEESDNLPLFMCLDCVDELEASYRFVQKALITEEQLLEKLDAYSEATSATGNLEIDEEDKKVFSALDLEGPVTCDICGQVFSNSFSLNAHIENEIQENDIEIEPDPGTIFHTVCSVCGQIFTSLATYEEHKMQKENKCTYCQKEFNSACELSRHSVNNCETKFFCSQCFKTFESLDQLEEHKKKHIENDWYCYMCETSWDNPEDLMSHKCMNIEAEISEGSITEDPNTGFTLKNKKGYKCGQCYRTYKRKYNLTKHSAKHKKIENPFQCKKCDLVLDSREDLATHMIKAHTKTFVCRFCGKSMTTKLSLTIHERIHMRIKPYICEWCGNKFRSKPNLSQHQAKHTGIRKHECSVCGKMFSRKAFVICHMRTHTGERPFSCDLCEQRFSQIGDMRRHRKRHGVTATTLQKENDSDQTVIMDSQKNDTYTVDNYSAK